jgi:hypothetical protein
VFLPIQYSPFQEECNHTPHICDLHLHRVMGSWLHDYNLRNHTHLCRSEVSEGGGVRSCRSRNQQLTLHTVHFMFETLDCSHLVVGDDQSVFLLWDSISTLFTNKIAVLVSFQVLVVMTTILAFVNHALKKDIRLSPKLLKHILDTWALTSASSPITWPQLSQTRSPSSSSERSALS